MNIVAVDKENSGLDFSDPRVIRDRKGATIYLTSISHLRVARSRDGVRFTVDEGPTVLPEGPLERWGIGGSAGYPHRGSLSHRVQRRLGSRGRGRVDDDGRFCVVYQRGVDSGADEQGCCDIS